MLRIRLTICRKSLHGAGGPKSTCVGDTDDRDEDDSVEDGGEDLDSGELNGDDERRVKRRCTSAAV